MLLSAGHADQPCSRLKMEFAAQTVSASIPAAPLAGLPLDLLALLPLRRCGAPG